MVINYLLNTYFFNKIKKPKYLQYSSTTKRSTPINWNYESKSKYFYKFRAIFYGEQKCIKASYSAMHSMLANLVLDYDPVPNECELITNLRENYNKIIEFSKDATMQSIVIKNIDIIYQGEYKEMLRHILISDRNLPSNINVSSLKKISDDLAYEICKRKK